MKILSRGRSCIPLKKRGVSTVIAIGTLIVGLLIGAGVIYGAAPALGLGGTTTTTAAGRTSTFTTSVGGGTTTTTVAGGTVTLTTSVGGGGGLCNGQTVTIGALNDLSGQLSSQGAGDLASENLAITDVNAYTQSAGCNLTFKLNAVDYKLDNPTALAQLQAMAAAGIQIVIGPLNSGTAAAILGYANSNHIVLLSPSSTSPALAIPNDYLFRTVVVNRDDTYGNGLANATKTFLQKDSISVVIKGPYKYDINTTDFSAILAQINSDYQTLSGQVGAANVAIFVVSFEEQGTMLIQANNNPTYKPLLSTSLPWFGTDGIAQNTKLTNKTTSGPLMAQVKFPSTLFNVINNSKTNAFFTRIKGTPAYAAISSNVFYSLEGYNDVWIAALSILSAGKNDGTAIHNVLPTVAGNFFGLTGWEGLQASGDRIPGSYQIWKVVAIPGGTYSWALAGTWSYDTDTVTWINAP
ncbi:MAG: ABC transporter substrate-binding protein [Thaumarchaeota archaeon]|nr:MAG: ABC transporter substrate-binding protein [Nitrososphaerota archaeon]